jgi:hypothetical protein
LAGREKKEVFVAKLVIVYRVDVRALEKAVRWNVLCAGQGVCEGLDVAGLGRRSSCVK